MSVQGFIETINANQITGWAFDHLDPNVHQAVIVYYQGEVLKKVLANQYREVFSKLGFGNGKCGFVFEVPPNTNSYRVVLRFEKDNRIVPRSVAPRIRRRQTQTRINHKLTYGHPFASTTFGNAEFTSRDLEIADRLIRSYHYSLSTTDDGKIIQGQEY
ncbi:MAG: hypothetical protein OEM26_17060, partial [Saprospiraceae bacterium]|nr:hypothetical protein [Saprospiraceae bacterium]